MKKGVAVIRTMMVTVIWAIFLWVLPAPGKAYPTPSPQETGSSGIIKIAQNPYFQPQDNRYQEWERLSPQEKEKLRQRWQYYKNLPPREQQLLRNRYEELKRLPPEEQRRIRDRLKRWEELTPEEQEAIRQKFRR